MEQFLQILISACAFFTALIGILALKQAPKNISNRFFFVSTLFTILWMWTLYLGFSYTHPETQAIANMFFRLAHGAGILAITMMTGFICFYPNKILNLSKKFCYTYFLFSIGLGIIASSSPLVYNSVVIYADGQLSDIFGPAYALFIIHTLGSQLFAIAMSLKKISLSRGLIKRKLQLCFFGFTTFALTAFMTNGILPIFGIYVLQREAPLFALLFLTPSFYSLYKHRFFNLSFQSLNITRHILLGLCFLSVGSIVYLSSSVLIQDFSNPISMGISALAGLLSYLYLSKKYPEMLSEAYQHFRKELLNLQQALYEAEDYQSLIEKLQKTFAVELNFTNPKLWMIRDKKQHSKIPIYIEDELTKHCRSDQPEILISEELSFHEDKHTFTKKLKDLNAQVCIPLYANKELIGLFTIGDKGDQSFYGEEEINLLLKFKKHLETCFMNILLESGLQKEKDLLEQNVSQKTKNIRDKYTRTKNLLKKQEDYLSLAAHELKNPLHTLMMQLEVSLSEMTGDDQTHQDLKIIEKSVEKLHRLTMNLFDSQQYDLDKAQLDLQNVKISELVNDIYFEFQAAMKDKQLIFTLDNRVSINTALNIDPTKIRQVLHNLLHNAMKFTPPSGNISLSLHETSSNFTIQISDTGCGVNEEDKERIFEKFQHGKEHHGLGIGLYLSKKVIQLHGGNLVVHDHEGVGSVFKLSLMKKEKKKAKGLKLEARS
jgi:signal transduction histidine kinase